MTSELFIENYRLDITTDISSLITFELDNVRDFSSRGTSWSKTIVLPGTANNNKLFGHIFQIGQSNGYNPDVNNVGYNFNASKSARCLIFQDQFQTFKGVLRLMQINITKGKPEYEVAVFGELAGLNVSLSGGLLEDLDFSAYDHTYNETAIVNSWDNTPGSGYYYPLIDYGQYSVDKHSWDIRTFRPALYVREYVDKMFTAAGYRWSSDLFNTDRFKRLVVPHNRKKLQGTGANLLTADLEESSGSIFIQEGAFNFINVSATDFSPVGAGQTIQYTGTDPRWVVVKINISGTYSQNGTGDSSFSVSVFHGNGATFTSIYTANVANAPDGSPFNIAIEVPVLFNNNDELYLDVDASNGASTWVVTSGSAIFENQAGTTVININPGDQTQLNNSIPTNIRQIDFLVSIVKLFNLYVWEDRFDSKLIYLKPYIDFYSTNSIDSIDWTYKLNRDKAIKISPMSELNAKKYEFKYKSDNDFWNDLYRKRYGQGYGDYTFDSSFEFSEQTKAFEIIFSATPLVGYDGEDKVISTIYKKSNEIEEQVDSNIRILQTKKITGVTSWDILDGPSTVLTSVINYGYAGHFDDPDAPSNDLNFGALRELFFVLVSGDLSATQFNVYWSAYMAEITDKDSKLVSAWFYLKPIDILNLDFSKKIFIDGVLFRLNSVKDYNATRPNDCQCELLKVNYLIY